MASNEMPMQTAPDHSPCETINAQGPVAQAIIRGETVRGWVTNALLAACVVLFIVNLWFLYVVEREQRLKEYDIGVVKSELIAPLEGAVRAQQAQLSALETRFEVREECERVKR